VSPGKEQECQSANTPLTQHAIIALLTDQGAEIEPGSMITRAEVREDPGGHERVLVTVRTRELESSG